MASSTQDPAVARSLADALRAAGDDVLADLLVARPDLINPVPGDVSALAARASTSASVMRALDRLDRWHLQVVEVLAALPDPARSDEVEALLPDSDPEDVHDALDRLRTIALVWGDDRELRLVRSVRQAMGQHPAGLGPSVADLPARATVRTPTRAAELDAVLAQAPEGAGAALDQLVWGPPMGHLEQARRQVDPAVVRTPVEWLLAHGLLVPVDDTTVVLPREVALHVRGGRVHAQDEVRAPQPTVTASRDPELVDRTAAAAAYTTVRWLEDVLEDWSVAPPVVLRSGGLGVRDLKATARAHEMAEPDVAVLLETAYAAGLLAAADDLEPEWLPTPAYDLWKARDPAGRWAVLVEAWRDMTRVPGLVGERDDRDRALTALSHELDRVQAPETRLGALEVLAALAPGQSTSVEEVTQALAWQRPRRGARSRAGLVRWALREAEVLGITGLGSLTTAGRAVVRGDFTEAAELAGALMPEPLDHVLLQADLTAVAPGPLTTELAHDLRLMAEVESRGAATVYRFTEGSVRRALDAGRSASELHTLVELHSRTPVPQPLAYLIDDVARRHGHLRVGTAAAYVRSDDPAALDQVAADRRAGSLRLRRLAPTVLAAQSPVDAVLERLREMGHAPAAEAPDGAIVVRRKDSRRTPPRQRPPRLVVDATTPSRTLIDAAVRAIRAGERASTAPRGRAVAGPSGSTRRLPRTLANETVELLRAAAAEQRSVWIGYVDNHGQTTDRVVDPLRVERGYLTAYDHRIEEVHTFAVHRITGVAGLDDDQT
ncbi:MAG: helicase C-terminal domain-containing protein [Candidatus Nanopelagicales bacterium]